MVNDYLMGVIFKGGDMGAKIKSIQRGIISIPSGSTAVTAAISAVDLTKTIIHRLGDSAFWNILTRSLLSFDDTETIRSDRGGDIGKISSVSYEIIELESGIKSLQVVTVEIPGAVVVADAAISEVDPAKTLVFYAGGIGEGNRPERWQGYVQLIDGTTLRANCQSTYAATKAWHGAFVLEFL